MLKFNGYDIEKLSLNKETKEFNDTNEDPNIRFIYKIIPENDEWKKYNILQGIKISATQEIKYNMEVIIRGYFEFEQDLDSKDKINMMKANSSAILYPYIRMLISLMSSQINEEITLPTLNFYNVLKTMGKDNFFLDKNNYQNKID